MDRKWDSDGVELASGVETTLNEGPAAVRRSVAVGSKAGCPHYGRWPVAQSAPVCDKAIPPLVEVALDHRVACFRYTGR